MRTPDTSYISEVLAAAESPCVSIYFPTQRSQPGTMPDLTRYKNMVRTADETLSKSYPDPTRRGVVERLQKLQDDPNFWRNNSHVGVAILASPARFDSFTLPRLMPERVEVGETFHVKPLLRFVQSAEPFHVLGLSRERVALFHGNRYELHPLEVAGIPLTLTDALGAETEQAMRRFHTAGPGSAVRDASGTHGAAISTGQGGRKDEIEIDTRRFFTIIDRAVTRLVSEPSNLPLIPAGIDDNLSEFRAVTKNRFVAAESVHGDWTNLSLPEIREKAWKVFGKHYLEKLAAIREDFGTAASRRQGTDDLAEAAKAALVGRVGILLIDDDRTVPGSIDPSTGALRPTAANGTSGDMLDDLAEMGLRTKAQVIVTPSSQMPTKTGLAAIFRY
jgi:hypothetical protein